MELLNVLRQKKYEYLVRKSKREFRKRNPHNNLQLNSSLPVDYIEAGKASYGPLNISYGSPEEFHLKIGSYVSISPNVLFLLANEHNTNTISTFPFLNQRFGMGAEAKSKGNIIVEDDVYIGSNAIICSGVHIHRGVVIAAGAVVTKDVPPYAVVAGVPAKVVKYRFNESIINRLMQVDIVKLFNSFTKADVDFIYDEDLTIDKLDSFINEHLKE